MIKLITPKETMISVINRRVDWVNPRGKGQRGGDDVALVGLLLLFRHVGMRGTDTLSYNTKTNGRSSS